MVGDLAGADRVAAVESPIDALSYYSLFGCRGGSLAVVSCAGACVPRELMLRALDRGQAFVVAFDRDPAGQRGLQKAQDETADWVGFKLSSDCPNSRIGTMISLQSGRASALPCSKKLLLSDNEWRPSYPDSGKLFLAASWTRGDPSAATPLFIGIYEGYPLSQVVANRFGLQLREAESAIDIARKEVAL